MKSGFEVFMENEHYRKFYENAPTERLKKYLKLSYNINPFVVGEDYDSSKEEVEIKTISRELNKSEVEYLASDASNGALKSAYKKWLAKFDE